MSRCLIVAMMVLAVCSPARAQLPTGHYQPGVFPIDAIGGLPPITGVFGNEFFIDYASGRINGNDGNAISRTRPLPSGRTATVDVHVNAFTALTYILGMTDVKIFGARYGAAMGIPLQNTGTSTALQAVDRGARFNTSGIGLGDIALSPVMLGWQGSRGSAWFGYTITLPVGRYSAGASDNVGLGFSSQMLQLGGKISLDKKQTLALAGLLSYEMNGQQRQTGVQVGDSLSIDYGIRKNFTPTFSAGITGYGLWQMTPTTGVSQPPSWRSSVLGLGGQLAWSFPKANNLSLTVRAIHELSSVNRFQGNLFTLNLSMPFALYPDPPPEKTEKPAQPDTTEEPKKPAPPEKTVAPDK